MASLDASTSGEVFRKNHPVIIANDRHLATIVGVRVANNSVRVAAGTVLGRNNVSGFYQPYSDIGASGIDTAVGILLDDIETEDFNSQTSTVGRLIVKGNVYENNLTGLDAAAKTDLHARSVIDGSNDTIMMF